MLASLSTKVSLEKSYLFKKYIEFIRNILNRKIEHIGQQKNINTDLDEQSKNWLLNIFINYIKYQIYTFLIWHEGNEIILQRKKSFDWYINEFYRMHDEFINLEFPQDIDSGLLNEYKIILRQNKMYSKMIHSLNQVYDIKTTKKNEAKIEALRWNLAMVATYVLKWYWYFDKKQLYEDINKTYSVKPILSFMPSDPKIGIDIEYSGTIGFKKLIKPDLRKIVKDSMQKELGLDIQINEIWKKPNKKPKMLSYGSIPV